MMATGALVMVIGAFLAAINAAVFLYALAYTHDANAIATCAFHHFYCFYCRAHHLHPLSAIALQCFDISSRNGWNNGQKLDLRYLFCKTVAKAGPAE
jgi:hypothetical protein